MKSKGLTFDQIWWVFSLVLKQYKEGKMKINGAYIKNENVNIAPRNDTLSLARDGEKI